MVTDPDVKKVVAICDRRYADKADGRLGGVGTESQIISHEVYSRVAQTKFIPIYVELFEEGEHSGQPALPAFFRSRLGIDMTTPEAAEAHYEQLIRVLYDKPQYVKPPLGKAPSFLGDASRPPVKTEPVLRNLRAAFLAGRPHGRRLAHEYVETLLTSLEDFRLTREGVGGAPLDEAIVASVRRFVPYRDNWVEFVDLVAEHMNDNEGTELLAEFFQQGARYFQWPKGLTSWNRDLADNYRFFLQELALYTVAVLLKRNRYATVGDLLGRSYFVRDDEDARESFKSLEYFRSYLRSLEVERNRRLELRLLSVAGDLLKENATNPTVTFQDVVQADFLTFLRTLVAHGRHDAWFPATLVYRDGKLPLFARAESRRYYAALGTVFGISSPDAFRSTIADALRTSQLDQRGLFSESMRPINIADVANLEKIGTRD
jgi:hypothetical protein